MDFGETLKNQRKRIGLTQVQLAKELNVSRSAISNWEIGRNYPDIETLMLLADVFQISVEELFIGESPIGEKSISSLVQKKKSSRRLFLFSPVLFLVVGLFLFLFFPKSPKIEWVEEKTPKNAPIVSFAKEEIQEISLEKQQLTILFDVPKKEAGYTIEQSGDEVWVSLYRFKEEKGQREISVLPHQGLMQIDLSDYSRPKKIKVSYYNPL